MNAFLFIHTLSPTKQTKPNPSPAPPPHTHARADRVMRIKGEASPLLPWPATEDEAAATAAVDEINGVGDDDDDDDDDGGTHGGFSGSRNLARTLQK